MRTLSCVLGVLVLAGQPAFAQQGTTIVDWLASLQAIEVRLRSNDDGASVAAELRALQREISSSPARG